MTKTNRKIRAREIRVGMTVTGCGVVASTHPSAYGRIIRYAEGSPVVQSIHHGSEWVEVAR